jgi:enolase-phosphatase E1
MDQDRKSTALKALQGRIWQEGYRRGELHGEVFPDVPVALKKWNDAGIDVRIYSSGSILAQQLLFSTTRYGDLTVYLKGYFDTTTGAKSDASSYATIARAFKLNPPEILFVSDVLRELDAAAAAAMQARLAVRPGNPPQPASMYPVIRSFDEI